MDGLEKYFNKKLGAATFCTQEFEDAIQKIALELPLIELANLLVEICKKQKFQSDWVFERLMTLSVPRESLCLLVRQICRSLESREIQFDWYLIKALGISAEQLQIRGENEQNYLGQEVCDVKIIQKVGGGGFVTVYRGRRLSDDSEVAIRIPTIKCFQIAKKTEMLRAEYRLRREMHIEGIPAVHNAMETEFGPIAICDFIDGTRFDKSLKLAKNLQLCVEAVAESAKIVARLHESGFIHGDIKPSNCLMTKSNTVYIVDTNLLLNRLHDGEIFGTSTFASPEQRHFRRRRIEVEIDVYGLGKTLEYLVNRALARCRKTLSAKGFSYFEVRMSSRIGRLIKAATSFDPHSRLESASEFVVASHNTIAGKDYTLESPRRVVLRLWQAAFAIGMANSICDNCLSMAHDAQDEFELFRAMAQLDDAFAAALKVVSFVRSVQFSIEGQYMKKIELEIGEKSLELGSPELWEKSISDAVLHIESEAAYLRRLFVELPWSILEHTLEHRLCEILFRLGQMVGNYSKNSAIGVAFSVITQELVREYKWPFPLFENVIDVLEQAESAEQLQVELDLFYRAVADYLLAVPSLRRSID